MALDIEPYSRTSIALAYHLADMIHRQSGKRYKITSELTQATGAMLGDLFTNAAEGIEHYGFRPMGRSTFTGMTVGYRPFTTVVKAMESLNLLEIHRADAAGPRSKKKVGEATTFRAKPTLFELAIGYGVTPGNWSSHFQKMPGQLRVPHPILLRSSSENFYGVKLPGKAMKVDNTLPAVMRMAVQVHDINGFTATQKLGLGRYTHSHFVRILGQGDTVGRYFTKGGRLYSPGKDSYQQMPSSERADITINDEATVEVDIASSFLTIYRVLTGVTFDPLADAYAIPGVPRFVSKSWVVMTFGHDRFHTRWPKEVKAKYAAQGIGSGQLQRDYPLKSTRALILAALPELANWPTSSIRWGDLQFLESCAVIEAVHTLAIRHRILGLPVHDSIRVPVSAAVLATQILSDAFYKHVGVRPVIKAK
jgi:hypothetical protein